MRFCNFGSVRFVVDVENTRPSLILIALKAGETDGVEVGKSIRQRAKTFAASVLFLVDAMATCEVAERIA